MSYAIVGCITKYSADDIRPYVESINKSGFKGSKYMLVYDIDSSVIDYLFKNKWQVIQSELQEHVILQRFMDMYAFLLDEVKDDIIIWTDVKDVVFQIDPSIWLDKNMNRDILAFSECVKLKDEDWAVVNSGTSFPLEWSWMKENISYCAGTIVGKREALRDLFNEIYRWSKTTANPEQLSDQAAFNVLINLHHFKNVVQKVNQEEGFATQLGTVLIKANQLRLTEPTPIYKEGKFYNQKGELFTIVHQYDRNPQIKQDIKKLYN